MSQFRKEGNCGDGTQVQVQVQTEWQGNKRKKKGKSTLCPNSDTLQLLLPATGIKVLHGLLDLLRVAFAPDFAFLEDLMVCDVEAGAHEIGEEDHDCGD